MSEDSKPGGPWPLLIFSMIALFIAAGLFTGWWFFFR